jgi:hypothetical protein
MEIIFRPMAYVPGIKLVDRTIGYVRSLEADSVSITANPMPGAPLSLVAERLNLDRARLHKAAVKSNRHSKIAVLENMTPRIFLIPKTTGNRDASGLIDDFLESAKASDSQVINFTHYGLIKGEVPEVEIRSVFQRLAQRGADSGIKVIVWDVDARHLQRFRSLHKQHFCATPS